MGFWPFGRKSSRKQLNTIPDMTINTMQTGPQQSPKLPQQRFSDNVYERGVPEPRRSRKDGLVGRKNTANMKKKSGDPEKRTLSFSPGRNDTIRVPHDVHKQHPVPAMPVDAELLKGRPAMHGGYEKDADWHRVPTLHKQKSKKRKEDHDRREAEIKAMSSTMPEPPSAFDGIAKGSLKRNSKKTTDSRSTDAPNAASTRSLAQPFMSASESESQTAFSLKGMFSPRPTIRYSGRSRQAGTGEQPGLVSTDSRKKSKVEREEMEKQLEPNMKIEDLADELDAGDLRELMERDQRRRDRKKEKEQRRLERRIARKAEKLKVAEVEAALAGKSPPKNMDRGVFGREVVGLGLDQQQGSFLKRRGSTASSRRRGKKPADIITRNRNDSSASRNPFSDITTRNRNDSAASRNPFTDFHRADSLAGTDAGSPDDELVEPVIATAQIARLSRASISPPASPNIHMRARSSISQMLDLSKPVPNKRELHDTPASSDEVDIVWQDVERPTDIDRSTRPQRDSSETGGAGGSSWTSFFKRNAKSKRASIPASFSNLSRESHSTVQRPSQSQEIQRMSSNLPRRTMSKFREDLPDFPISPPDSRVQSPETDEVPPIKTDFGEKRGSVRASTENPFADGTSRRNDTPTSGWRSLEVGNKLRNETPTSGHRSSVIPSPEPVAIMSTSMASIDSEGSWLSGRPRANSKLSIAPVIEIETKASVTSLMPYPEYSDSVEELGIAEDEYFSRLTPGADEMFEKSNKTRRASGNPMPSSDEEDGDSLACPNSPKTKWGAVQRRPTLIEHAPRVKSREGLLNVWDTDSDTESLADVADKSSEVGSPVSAKMEKIQRATSIPMGRAHVRHISAGSAKLLDVKPRDTVDGKRLSAEARENRNI